MINRIYGWLMCRHPLLYVAGAAVFMGCLLYLGGKQEAVEVLPSPIPYMDKIYHFMAYGTLSGMVWFSLKKETIWPVVAAIAMLGAVDELHQATLSFRSCDGWDLLTDVLSAVATALVLRAIHVRWVLVPTAANALSR